MTSFSHSQPLFISHCLRTSCRACQHGVLTCKRSPRLPCTAEPGLAKQLIAACTEPSNWAMAMMAGYGRIRLLNACSSNAICPKFGWFQLVYILLVDFKCPTFVAKRDFECGCWVCWMVIFLHSMEANAYAIGWLREEFVEDTVHLVLSCAWAQAAFIKPSSCRVLALLFSSVGMHDSSKTCAASSTYAITYIHIFKYTYVRRYIYTYTYIYTYIQMYIYTYIYTYIST